MTRDGLASWRLGLVGPLLLAAACAREPAQTPVARHEAPLVAADPGPPDFDTPVPLAPGRLEAPLVAADPGLGGFDAPVRSAPGRQEAPLVGASADLRWAPSPRDRLGWHLLDARLVAPLPGSLAAAEWELLVGELPRELPEHADPPLRFRLAVFAEGALTPLEEGHAHAPQADGARGVGSAIFSADGLLVTTPGGELRPLVGARLANGRALASSVDVGSVAASGGRVVFLKGYPADELWDLSGRVAAGLSPAWSPAVEGGRVVLVSGRTGAPRWTLVGAAGEVRELPLPVDTPVAASFSPTRLAGDELLFEDAEGSWWLHLGTGARRRLPGGRAPVFSPRGAGAFVHGAWRPFPAP